MLPWGECNVHFRLFAYIWYCGYNYAIVHRTKLPASLPSSRNCTDELVAVLAFEPLLVYTESPQGCYQVLMVTIIPTRRTAGN